MKNLLLVLAISLWAINAQAKVKTQLITYKDGDATLEGYLAYDDEIKGKRPGVLVVHEWTGINPNIEEKTQMLAKLGYIAFAADIYGKGIRPTTPDDAAKQATIYKSDRKLMRSRVLAGLNELRKQELTDTKKLAAIGYCFGGTVVLELARSGADISGVVSFHGGVDPVNPEDAKNIKAKILALHGADDPYVKMDEVLRFQDEMRKAGVDWQMVFYGGAVHSFTNPFAGNDNSKGAAYNEKAAQRAWQAMQLFFSEIFK